MQVKAFCHKTGAELRYTTDGKTVDQNSTLYYDGIIITDDTKLKIQAFFDGKPLGKPFECDYTKTDKPEEKNDEKNN